MRKGPVLWLVMLWALLCIPVGHAGAAEEGRVAVLAYPQPGEARPAQELAQALREAVIARGRRVVSGTIDAALDILVREQEERATQALRLGEARIERGRQELARVELERAETSLMEAEAALLHALILPGTPQRLAEALRWRGVAKWELRQRGAAAQLFLRALMLRPKELLTEAEVRPDVAAGFRQAAAETRRRARLTMTILQGERVWVDGVEVGLAAGLAEVDVVPGDHVVLVQKQASRRAEVISVPISGLNVQLQVDSPAVLALRRQPGTPALVSLCQTLGLESVVLAASGQEGRGGLIVAQRFDCSAQTATAQEVARFEGKSPLGAPCLQLVDRLWREGALLESKQTGLLDHPALLKTRRRPRQAFYQRPWLWLGLATVSAGVLLSAALWPRDGAQTIVAVEPGRFALSGPAHTGLLP